MGWGLLIAAFGTPSAGVSPLVVYIACLPFILSGMAVTMHSFGRPTRRAVISFLTTTAILLPLTGIGFGPAQGACEATSYVLGLFEPTTANCTSAVAAALAIVWLTLGVAFFAYVFKSRDRPGR